MFKRSLFLLGLMLSVLTLGAQAGDAGVTLLNAGWSFTLEQEGAAQAVEVNLPHTWNAEDTLAGNLDYFRGKAVYERTLSVKRKEGRKYYLRFRGVNQNCEVRVNGELAGTHRGGYTAFIFDVTDLLQNGQNALEVRVDNSWDEEVMPLIGDFNMYGGIYRDVELIEREPVHFTLSHHGSDGVWTTASLNDDFSAGTLTISAGVEQGAAGGIELSATLMDPAGKKAAETVISASEASEAGFSLFSGSLKVDAPELWDSVENPALYTLKVMLLDRGRIMDKRSVEIGFRKVEVDPVKGFFLNGRHYKVFGVNRHQDFEGLGNAITTEQHQLDFDIMLEMGVNAVRFAHYPHDKQVYEMADRSGILAWAEIPFVGPGGYAGTGFTPGEGFADNAQQQLKEMIWQNINHPSIVMWGLFNELNKSGEGPGELMKALQATAKKVDPSRYTTCAVNANRKFNDTTDLLAWNKYYGWYGSSPSLIGSWADSTHKADPSRPLGISEYGAGASIKHHTEKNRAPIPTSYFHPENWQTYFHEGYWKVIDKRDFLWGTFVWNMFDFGASHRTEGDRPNVNDKGLVTFDRKHKKDAFYFYKANWSKEPVLHINRKNMRERKKSRISIRLYSNQGMPELKVNGKVVKLKSEGYQIYSASRVKLVKGENRVEVEVQSDDGSLLKDSVVWNYKK